MTVTGQHQTTCVVGGQPLNNGDRIEVRGIRIGEVDARDSWIPMVAFDEGRRLEFEDGSDWVPGNRGGPPVTFSLAEIVEAGGEIRRRT